MTNYANVQVAIQQSDTQRQITISSYTGEGAFTLSAPIGAPIWDYTSLEHAVGYCLLRELYASLRLQMGQKK